ncbi:MAG: SMI1/KNR4 family protein [Tepidibacter sp.]|jgi:hypothetical protein|uniref:SMI1/KNR4 family protein n=1 Tax=Tepidibacter sp. TaxID=2529387 RepID=UPI0025F77B2D|nr:SMI1/KNR4 family protein [Tepidibacter sp.]MCT4507408.1 SMI1/KNR4 family protein [Tepidibacter sp.]
MQKQLKPMTLKQDIEFIRKHLDNYFIKIPKEYLKLEAKIYSNLSEEDGGVPAEMMLGEVDNEGYVCWSMIPSNITENDINYLEKEYFIKLPKLFKAYLMGYCFLMGEFNNGSFGVTLPEIPFDNPLMNIESNLFTWRLLIGAGYIPFGEYEGGYGPICFDITQKNEDEDYAIVWFNHENLFNLDYDQWKDRSDLEQYSNKLYDSFRELIIDLLT